MPYVTWYVTAVRAGPVTYTVLWRAPICRCAPCDRNRLLNNEETRAVEYILPKGASVHVSTYVNGAKPHEQTVVKFCSHAGDRLLDMSCLSRLAGKHTVSPSLNEHPQMTASRLYKMLEAITNPKLALHLPAVGMSDVRDKVSSGVEAVGLSGFVGF